MKHILVGVDGSKYSLDAVKAAARLASERNIKSVTLINVIPTVVTEIGPFTTNLSQSDLETWEVFEKPKVILEEAGVKARLLLREGDPAYEITRVAETENYDLIVVGHRGLSPVKAFLLGSVSNRIVTHAPCSVLVVRLGLENGGNNG